MSGPKISVYKLDERSRKLVLGQLRCEQLCIACARSIGDMLHEASSYRLQLEELAASGELMASRGGAPEAGVRFTELIRELEDGCKGIRDKLDDHRPSLSTKYEITEAALAEKESELALLKSLQKQAADLRNKLDAAVGSGERSRARASERIERSIAEDLTEFVDFGDIGAGRGETTFDELKNKTSGRLTALIKSGLPAPLEADVRRAMTALSRISAADGVKTFNAVTLAALERRAAEHFRKDEALREEYAADVSRYLALCSALEREGTAPEYSKASAAAIKEDIERLELELLRRRERSYISECVDEVMAEMGYDLIGSRDVKTRSGRSFRSELFTFSEGTAVNVTYSSDGQISMEMGGILREDRLPTDAEADVLTGEMETFCGEFGEFERRLRARGVVLGDRIALSPPTADYASTININNYDVEAGRTIAELDVREKRRDRASEKRALRRDE